MFCKKCGTELVQGAAFCHKCGRSVHGVAAATGSNAGNVAVVVIAVLVGGLMLIVIIGILAAIAIPKFADTKEKAYAAAMKSDLKNLAISEEAYFSKYQTYTTVLTAAQFNVSTSVNISVTSASGTGWAATATHNSSSQKCTIAYGTTATTDGVPICAR